MAPLTTRVTPDQAASVFLDLAYRLGGAPQPPFICAGCHATISTSQPLFQCRYTVAKNRKRVTHMEGWFADTCGAPVCLARVALALITAYLPHGRRQ